MIYFRENWNVLELTDFIHYITIKYVIIANVLSAALFNLIFIKSYFMHIVTTEIIFTCRRVIYKQFFLQYYMNNQPNVTFSTTSFLRLFNGFLTEKKRNCV